MEKEQMDFLYPGLDLSLMDVFKVVCGGQLVDDTWYPLSIDLVTSPAKDTQVETEGNKATKDDNLDATVSLEFVAEEVNKEWL